MSGPTPAAAFSLKRVQQMLGLSRTVVSGLIGAGFVTPQRGPRNEHRFSFQDLLVLRTAHVLRQANIPPRKVLQALTRLRSNLPDELPLTGLRISAVGSDVVVRDRQGRCEASTGQLLMDFEVAPVDGSVAFFAPASAEVQRDEPAREPDPVAEDANAWFERAEACEATDLTAAEAAYRMALSLSPAHVPACLNLGFLLCEASRCDDAVAVYENALAHGARDAVLHFNHAIALEDQQRLHDALASYRLALTLDAGFADAHYNAGRLLELLGDALGALRHFNAYRRLQRGEGA